MKKNSKFYSRLAIGVVLISTPFVILIAFLLFKLASAIGWLPIFGFFLFGASVGVGAKLLDDAINDDDGPAAEPGPCEEGK